jgi:hypothetical protein
MAHHYGRKRGYHSQRRFDHWRFWGLLAVGVAITAGAIVLAFFK